MIKIALPSDSSQSLGGGFSFRRNLIKGIKQFSEHNYVEAIEDSDVCLVASTSMVNRETVDKIKSLGKKLVIRNDNLPRNSRNRNTGTSRLKEFNQKADVVIFQSKWAQLYLGPFIGKMGTVIYNGVDTDIFNQENITRNEEEPIYLYSKFSKDPTKNWWETWYKYQFVHRDNPKSQLWIVGKLEQEIRETIPYNWDFYNGEIVKYLGIITDPKRMAEIYKTSSCLMASYFIDCYSQTYVEAAMCGCKLFSPNMSGGTPELLKNLKKGAVFNGIERMTKDYVEVFEKLLQ